MSQLWTPPGSTPKPHPLGRGAEPLKNTLGEHEIGELLPSEFNEMKIIMAQVQGKYSREYATEDVQKRMSLEIQHRLAEELGLLCAIEWLPTDIIDIDGMTRPVLSPTVTITGRTSEVEIDHDRIRHEVQSGEMDGKVGKMDEAGAWKE